MSKPSANLAAQNQKFALCRTFPEKTICGIRDNAWPGLRQTRLRGIIDYIDDLYDIAAHSIECNPTVPHPAAGRHADKWFRTRARLYFRKEQK
jgi:hypothetical protein